MTIERTSKPAPTENVAFRRLAEGEGGVLLHLGSGEYHGINDMGCLIWELLDGQRTVDDIVLALEDEVEDPPPDLAGDVVGFLESLSERDLVR